MSGIKEGVGIGIFVKIVLSHSTEKLRRGTLLCLTKFLVSKKFMDKMGRGRGREYHHFPSKNFCLSVPKFSYGNPLAFHYFRVSKNVRDKRGGIYDLPSKTFRHSAEKLQRDPSVLQNASDIEKFCA